MEKWSFLLSGKQNPFYNMALDEMLFSRYQYIRTPVFRIYGWEPHAISIGYNQNIEEAIYIKRCQNEGIPVIRRLTGGGAIFHSDEITYSIVCPEDYSDEKKHIKESYKKLCSFLIHFYKTFGLSASFANSIKKSKVERPISNFCFSSCEEYDIIVNNKKIGGNAQRRKKGIILQHGSIPFYLDFNKISYLIKAVPVDISDRTTYLRRFCKQEVSFQSIEEILLQSFKKVFSSSFTLRHISNEENTFIQDLIDDKYNTLKWTYKWKNQSG